MKLKHIGILVVVFIVSFMLSYYLRNSDFVRELFNPKTKIEFHNTTFDFGNILYEKEAITYFVYKNTGKHSLRTINIQSGCGFTVPKWSRNKLEPGEKDSIMVMYDAKTAKKLFSAKRKNNYPAITYFIIFPIFVKT